MVDGMNINNGTIAELEYQRGVAQLRCLDLATKYQDALDRAAKAEARVNELEAEIEKTKPVEAEPVNQSGA